MDKALVRSFINWLEEASVEQIKERQAQALALLETLRTEEAITGVKYSLHLIEQELVARYCLEGQVVVQFAA
ncbi:hypothetical protein [Methylophilus sp. QUAN]|uniref:hypothetical protein n=1 Tax=Methylophilus sp. QUAN TaxID=2781020 RepID=UPI00188F1AD5|nr:hypothetical protein [Methylophilus sp. QUAN]MBF4991043.1 hypothetical protein [Methylophilus sp. QUAN]